MDGALRFLSWSCLSGNLGFLLLYTCCCNFDLLLTDIQSNLFLPFCHNNFLQAKNFQLPCDFGRVFLMIECCAEGEMTGVGGEG